jgi:cyanate permease
VREGLAGPQSRRRAQPDCTPGEHGNDECGPARPSPFGPGWQRAHRGVAGFTKAASLGGSPRLALHPAATPAHSRFLGFSGLCGQGGGFALALSLIVMRSGNAQITAQLSAMAQGWGYLLAAGGPLLVGVLREWTGGYAANAWLVGALAVAMA